MLSILFYPLNIMLVIQFYKLAEFTVRLVVFGRILCQGNIGSSNNTFGKKIRSTSRLTFEKNARETHICTDYTTMTFHYTF